MNWIEIGSNGLRRYSDGYGRYEELTIKRAELPDGHGFVYRFEDEVQESSGKGGSVPVVRPSYIFVPSAGGGG